MPLFCTCAKACGENRSAKVSILWRRMEDYAARHPGTPLFVPPVYRDSSWRPLVVEVGLLTGARLWSERFANQ